MRAADSPGRPAPLPLSVCVITKDEEEKLPACLESVRWAAEVVVVDDFSTDATEPICRSFANVRYHARAFDGFGMQKAHAVSLSAHDWVFNLDADEVVTPELRQEIEGAVLGQHDYAGFKVRRRNLWFGRYHTDNYPGVLRLFRRDRGTFGPDYVHEQVQLEGKIGQLEALLLHHPRSHESFRAHYEVYVRQYGRLAARDYYARGQRLTPFNGPWKLVGVPALVFLREYLLKRKALLGKAGLYVSAGSALCYHHAYRHLWALQRQEGDGKGRAPGHSS